MVEPDIADVHKSVKAGEYWENLTGGVTAAYKEAMLDRLIREYSPPKVQRLLDIGCGTCEVVLRYQRLFPGSRAMCMDHDPKVIAGLRDRFPDAPVDWIAADAFALSEQGERFDLVFLLDVVHEIYSFYGRPDRRPEEPIDHALGLAAVARLFAAVGAAVRPAGLVCITDNVLCEQAGPVKVRLKTKAVADAVRYFFEHYPSRRMVHDYPEPDVVELGARDFCILLSQYNKIKAQNWERWSVERMEIHQYYTLSEYEAVFGMLGFDLFAVVGTPEESRREYESDFEVLSGLSDIPQKRITLAARKREGA